MFWQPSVVEFLGLTTQEWEKHKDFILNLREIALEHTEDGSVLMKIGDGLKPWEELKYFPDNTSDPDGIDLSGYLKKDLSNIDIYKFDEILRETNAYKELDSKLNKINFTDDNMVMKVDKNSNGSPLITIGSDNNNNIVIDI